ncbi:hypothetical protein [Paenibacillus swuensis]|nr:hypothetical protein [Paenibacillus swuensis]
MDKLVISIVVTVILIGIAFYVFNAEIGPGLVGGGENLKLKIEDATS